MKRERVGKRIAWVTALVLGVTIQVAEALDAMPLCGSAIEQIALPGRWSRKDAGDVVSFRASGSTESVTSALYAFPAHVVDEKERVAILLKATQVDRAVERNDDGARAELSEVTRRQIGAWLQACHSGIDPDRDRRFVSVTLASRHALQHLYYEAVGLSAAAFASRAGVILASPSRPALSLVPGGLALGAPRPLLPALPLPVLSAGLSRPR